MPNIYLKDKQYRRILKKYENVNEFVAYAVEKALQSESL
jgi:hypothetical protein